MTDPGSGLPLEQIPVSQRSALLLHHFIRNFLDGKKPQLEHYLKLMGATENSTGAIELLSTEMALRESRGEIPSLEEYQNRFPHLSSALIEHIGSRQQIQTDALISEHKEAHSRLSDPPHSKTAIDLQPESQAFQDARTLQPGEEDLSAADTLAPLGQDTAEAPASVTIKQIAGYEIIGELGRGGMGVVYKARQKGLNRLVALKMILRADHASREERERFQREAEAIARLDHPNIVHIFEIGEHEGKPFFSLELLPGGSLTEKLNGTPLKPAEAAVLVEKLARAMHVAHQTGVLHRDLKPANVLLSQSGEPRITDFGLAKKLDEASQTRTGEIMGTPSYMAPEQADPEKYEIGPATDVYALGAILYECLTGRPPFKAATPLDTVFQVLTEAPVPLRQLQPNVSKDLETICMKCLRKEPDKRYETALELAEDLRRYLGHEPILARPMGRWERTVKWLQRHPTLAGISLVVLLACIGFLIAGISFTMRLDRARLRAEAGEKRATLEAQNALQQQKIAREHEAEAVEQEEMAIRARREADLNFAQARKAINQFFTEVSENTLLMEPGMRPLRRKLLAASRELYADFVKQHADNPELQFELGRSEVHLGHILAEIETVENGIKHYERAIEIFNRLPEQRREQPEVQTELARAHYHLGRLKRQLSQVPAAHLEYKKAIQYWSQLVKEHPDQLRYQAELARSQMGLATALAISQQLKEARALYLKTLEVREKLARLELGNADYQRDLAVNLDNLALIQARLDETKESLEANGRAEAILRGLRRKHPRTDRYQNDLARNRYNRGNLLLRRSRFAESEQPYQEAAELWKNLVEAHPTVIQYQSNMSNAFQNQAIALFSQGKKMEADRLYQQWEDFTQALAKRYPTLPTIQLNLAKLYLEHGRRDRQDNRLSSAVEKYQKALDILENLHKSHSQILEYEIELAGAMNDRAALYREQDQMASAVELGTKALSLLKNGIQLSPLPPEKSLMLVKVTLSLARFYQIKGQADEALEHCTRSLKELDYLDKIRYRSTEAEGHRRNAHMLAAQAMTQKGEFQQALVEWDEAIKVADKGWQKWLRLYRLGTLALTPEYSQAIQKAAEEQRMDGSTESQYEIAAIYAAAQQSVTKDANLSGEQKRAQASELAKKARALLDKVRAKGWFKRQERRDAIRVDIRFKALFSPKGLEKYLNAPILIED